ncbi:MAG: PEGA domain-containing protein [Acidobacteriota bacterium]
MRRGLHLAAAFVVAFTAAAHAGGSHKVMVETEPAGAHVYVNDVETGSVCDKTPCSFDAPIGGVLLIVQLQNYAPKIDQIDVPKRPKKPLIFHYKLDPAVGTIVIDAPAAAKGATVTIDDVDHGKVGGSGPTRVEIEPGGHHVVVALAGKTLHEEIVNVDIGTEVPVKVDAPAAATTTASSDGVKPDDTTTTTTTTTTSISTKAPSREHAKFISGDVIADIGFRRFSYTNPTVGPLAPESEDGQVIAGPEVEVWPSVLAGWDHLRGLSVFVRLELPLNKQDVLDSMKQPIATTYWMSFEASLHQTWKLGNAASLEVGGGYVQDQLRFNGDIGGVMKLPDCDYQSIRLGARGSLLLGAIEPYVAVETRAVQDGGQLGTRFQSSSATGFRGAVGIAVRGGSFVGRVEGSDLHYDWTLSQNANPGNFNAADGATDKVLGISFLLGYQY